MALDIQCDVAGIGAEWDNDWHIASLFIIIGTSAVGAFLPIISQTTRMFKGGFGVPGFIIQLGQFFGAGVVIATAFIHLFPTASLSLASPCLGTFADRYGAWASLIAMTTVFTMHSIEWWLVEIWMGKGSDGQRRKQRRMCRWGIKKRLGRCFGSSGGQGYSSDDHGSDIGDEDDDDMLFPAYSRAFNASRMILPQTCSPPQSNPYYAFNGTSTMSRSSRRVDGKSASIYPGGFALSKYGNYAAVIQSRQHLAMITNDRLSRYLYSEPQFPHYGPSVFPLPPLGMGRTDVLSMRGGKQAKSTPELLRKYQKSIRKSHGSSAFVSSSFSSSASARNTQSSHGVSLRPNSFSKRVGAKIRSKVADKGSKDTVGKQRCLSMPRLPPTTLDAAVCDSLLDPLSVSGSGGSLSDNARSRNSRSSLAAECSSSSDSCVSSQNPENIGSHPVSVAAAAAAVVASRRHSLHLSTGSQKSSLSEPYGRQGYSAGRLDPVPENGDSWGTSIPYRSADNVLSGLPPLSASLRTHLASGQTTYLSAKTHKRVSIPTPRSPSSAVQPKAKSQSSLSTSTSTSPPPPPIPPLPMQSPLYQPPANSGHPSAGRSYGRNAVSSEYPLSLREQRRGINSMPLAEGAQMPRVTALPAGHPVPPADACGVENDQESTAIHSSANVSAVSKYRLPVEVKRRALVTYLLELGIALYSVLIGLALAISHHGFFALFIAVCFHQFFEGLALGTSLAELYWIKAQIAAEAAAAETDAMSDNGGSNGMGENTLASDNAGQAAEQTGACVAASDACVLTVDQSAGRVHNSARSNVGFSRLAERIDACSDSQGSVLEASEFIYGSSDKPYARSKSRRTLTSMATSFTPEPWQ
ncbi:hypothetical protein LPJ75_002159, partial [Coemansia sp. RSA 2598]